MYPDVPFGHILETNVRNYVHEPILTNQHLIKKRCENIKFEHVKAI